MMTATLLFMKSSFFITQLLRQKGIDKLSYSLFRKYQIFSQQKVADKAEQGRQRLAHQWRHPYCNEPQSYPCIECTHNGQSRQVGDNFTASRPTCFVAK